MRLKTLPCTEKGRRRETKNRNKTELMDRKITWRSEGITEILIKYKACKASCWRLASSCRVQSHVDWSVWESEWPAEVTHQSKQALGWLILTSAITDMGWQWSAKHKCLPCCCHAVSQISASYYGLQSLYHTALSISVFNQAFNPNIPLILSSIFVLIRLLVVSLREMLWKAGVHTA